MFGTTKKDIMKQGGVNPMAVPGFPSYFLTEDGRLWSVKGSTPRVLKMNKAKYYVLSDGYDSVTCSQDKLRYCVENGVNPLTMSKCELALAKGENRLIDYTDKLQDALRCRRRSERDNAEKWLETAEKWCHHVLAYYHGDAHALVVVGDMLNSFRPLLSDHVQSALHLTDENKIRFVVDEVVSETLQRVVNRDAVVYSPYMYMKCLCRRLNDNIKKVGGKARLENGDIRIIGGWKKETIRDVYRYDDAEEI
jgi:hypothetical protein